MDKRYLSWGIPIALLAVLASQFAMRSDLRALASVDYWKSLSRYGKVLRIVESEFVHADEVSFHDLTDVALRGAVGSLDFYSEYMTPDDYEHFNMAANQQYVGVGIEIGQFSGRVIITNVFEQGSATSAGVLTGDFIVGVDGADTRTEALPEVVDRIRGEPGSLVILEVERPITERSLFFEMERRPINLDSVVDIEMKSDSVGYFHVRQFIDDTELEMVAAIQSLDAQGMRGLILDLRGNPGGRLDTAASMAEVFLRQGQKILTVQSRRGVEDVFEARGSPDAYLQPMVVLIDGNSASASEILAGALRDHARAILIGEKSYGKGSVQSIFTFPGGDGLKLTSARYLLPSGEAINGTGVYPNINVELSREEAIVLMLQKHHLRNMSEADFIRAFGFEPFVDPQLKLAEEILEGLLATKPGDS